MAAGFVCQASTREDAGLVVDMICQKKMGKCALLLVGPLGTGKTAFAHGISQEIGSMILWIYYFLFLVTIVFLHSTSIFLRG